MNEWRACVLNASGLRLMSEALGQSAARDQEAQCALQPVCPFVEGVPEVLGAERGPALLPTGLVRQGETGAWV